MDRTENEPYGAIIWPADTDKMGQEWRRPLNARARRAVESALRKRQRVGTGWLFPAPKDSSKPVRMEQASAWLRKAEELTGLEPQEGGLWHPYRRLWVTCRKRHPDPDVARAGGWASLEALRQAYQRPDAKTNMRVVMQEAELREVQ